MAFVFRAWFLDSDAKHRLLVPKVLFILFRISIFALFFRPLSNLNQ